MFNLSGLHSTVSTTEYCNSDNVQLCSQCCSQLPAEGQIYGGCTVPGQIDLALNAITLTIHMHYPHTATVAALISGVLLVITTSLITSCIMWWVVLRRQKRKDTSPNAQLCVQQPMTPSTELVEYEVPVLKQQRQEFTIQDNVAYGEKITAQQNIAYGQVYMK